MFDKEEFAKKIEEQIKIEEDYSKVLKDGKRTLNRSRNLIAIPLILLMVYIIIINAYNYHPSVILMMWIVASFIIYMVFFFLMMVPSLGTDYKQNFLHAGFRESVFEFLRLANLIKTFHKNRFTFIEFFWNAYLVNTKPVIKGFVIIFALDIFFATIIVIAGIISPVTYAILMAQIVVILILYHRVAKAVPGTPGFFTGISLAENTEQRFSLKKLKVMGAVAFSMTFTALIMVGAMVIPGMTLSKYIGSLPVLPSSYPLLIVLILVFQLSVIRYLLGVESRKLMTKLNKNHLSVLRNNLMPRVRRAKPNELSDLKREFIIFSMNKLIVQEFFHRFPAYVLMPNFFIILDPVAREILDEKGEDKSFKEGLSQIL